MTKPLEDKPLCVACGLCCDGTLHGQTNVEITNKDAGNYKKSSIKLSNKIITTFEQPCVEYDDDTGCNIYEQRPKTCSGYKCKLLRKVENKKLAKTKALEIIKSARNNRDVLTKHLTTKICFIKPNNLLGKFMLIHGKDIKNKLSKKEFIKSNKEIFTAYFAFDYLLDNFIHNRNKFKNNKSN